jgi:drug/metabolite transporter (DMT)-like permease
LITLTADHAVDGAQFRKTHSTRYSGRRLLSVPIIQKISTILLFLSYALCSGSGLVILKNVVSNQSTNNLNDVLNVLLSGRFVLGFLFYACGFILWMVILSKFKLNVAFPIAMSLFFIVSSLGSYFFLKESFGIQNMIGILLCFGGIWLITIE